MNVVGTCRILFCLDLARGIDLTAAQDLLTSWRRAAFHHKGAVPRGDALLPPLRVTLDVGRQAVSPEGGAWSTHPEVELALYDQGALCATWQLPFDGPLEELVELSAHLYDNANLRALARKLAHDLLESLKGAATQPAVSDLVEDYVVFEIAALSGGVEDLTTTARGTVAQVLRAERDPLSNQEIEDALSAQVAYRAGEVCLIDWLSSILVGSSTEDERLVLELATVELLELRLLDSQLDTEIGEAYRLLARPRRRLTVLTVQRGELQRVGQMQADGAVLHEGIDNALKLLGDDYLARLYRTAAVRFHFNEWDASIERKLGFLRNVYENLADVTAHRRAEVLEWIIIVLIAVDIVLYLLHL